MIIREFYYKIFLNIFIFIFKLYHKFMNMLYSEENFIDPIIP